MGNAVPRTAAIVWSCRTHMCQCGRLLAASALPLASTVRRYAQQLSSAVAQLGSLVCSTPGPGSTIPNTSNQPERKEPNTNRSLGVLEGCLLERNRHLPCYPKKYKQQKLNMFKLTSTSHTLCELAQAIFRKTVKQSRSWCAG